MSWQALQSVQGEWPSLSEGSERATDTTRRSPCPTTPSGVLPAARFSLQSFFVPKDEIAANDYDLSINKYKEVEKVKVEYEDPSVVLGRIEGLQSEINAAIAEFREKYL
mgnify:CR=1 FL=1